MLLPPETLPSAPPSTPGEASADNTPPPLTPGQQQFESDVQQAALKLHVAAEAKAIEKARLAPPDTDLDSEYLTLDQLDSLPKPEWLIEGVLSRNAYAILRGRDGTYKSFAAIDWALSLASGHDWQGRPTVAARVLYVAAEGAHGVAARIKAWESAWGKVDHAKFVLRKSAVNLFNGGPALDHLLRYVETGGFALVVVDTLRRSSGGADGNSTDMGVVVDNVDRVKCSMATARGTVLVLAHTDKGDNDSRGFSGVEDDADIVWHAKREEGSSDLDLVNTKMKDAADGAVIKLAAVRQLDSLILQHRGDDDTTPEQVLRDSEQKVLIELQNTFSTTGATPNQLVTVTGLSEKTIYRAQGVLLKAGRITAIRTGNSTLIRLVDSVGHGMDIEP